MNECFRNRESGDDIEDVLQQGQTTPPCASKIVVRLWSFTSVFKQTDFLILSLLSFVL